MATVHFTANLQRHIRAEPMQAEGATVREVLDHAFAQRPELRSFVLDEQGALRTHIVVFVGQRPVVDRTQLSDTVPPATDLHVMQALSGG